MPLTTVAKVPSSQQLLNIEEIREGVIILKNGELRAILLASGINFALKSEEEQDALTYAFLDFLNSLDWPLQIVIQSRAMVIADYLTMLEGFEENQKNELLKMQTAEYRNFIKDFVGGINIMNKNFYVVMSLHPMGLKKITGGLDQMTSMFLPKKAGTKLSEEKFTPLRSQLLERVNYIRANLLRMEINSHILDTEQLIELFWSLYNPGEGEAPVLPEKIEGVKLETVSL